ncbi:M18 family aminopeptidase [Pseudobutyrivibrio ruminis]|uniref:M18 family aminopeptidase n=1 Tax=Pseudobutyrivibrio ruminis TaxID=46206 RepID=UPI0003F93E51|nr:M18 family aminopeptidase [Pseudobutyrivibrio ruminis]
MNKTVKGLFEFIEGSPSQFHVVENERQRFLKEGFIELSESKQWNIELGKNYFVTRNGSSILAFRMPNKEYKSFMIMASHSDSPSFRIKEMPEMKEGHYVKLNTEKYGGMLMAPWFDRPLSIAGRAIIKTKNGIETKLVNLDKDLCMLPSLAIHMNREANDGYKYNPQKDLLPLVSMDENFKLKKLVADSLSVKEDDILGSDLFLYNREPGKVWGANDEFISIRRLDDLQCSYSSMMGLLAAKNSNTAVQVHVTFDNEEVGSGTKQGADSTFLYDTLVRINEAMNGNNSTLLTAIANSFMVSADNAHALHPNYPEKSDPTNKVFMNEGVVIKFNANQKYMTDGLAYGIFAELCNQAKVPYQTFVNRSDVAGGSTLGNISNAHVSINGVDIGLAQLAMHSCYETAGVKDTEYLLKIATKFYESVIENISGSDYTVQ